MKANSFILAGAITALGLIGTAGAANIVNNVGSIVPTTDILASFDNGSTRSRQVANNATGGGGNPQSFAYGQSFTVLGTGDFAADSIYLKSATGEDFSAFTGNFEIAIYAGDAGSGGLMQTIIFNPGTDTGVDADAISAANWVQFGFDGVNLVGGQEYTFLAYFTTQSTGNTNQWGFRRERDGNQYTGGTSYYNNSMNPADWPATFTATSDGANADELFYVTGTAVPEPASFSLLLLSGLGLLRRRR